MSGTKRAYGATRSSPDTVSGRCQHGEIKCITPQSQYTLCQDCRFPPLISRCTLPLRGARY
eukprot:600157-Rhodomonas_salina.1